jgi:hypothetical protein
MNTLDKKLKAIAHRIMQLDPKGDYGYSLPEYIEQIKQAFIDDGWIKPDKTAYEAAKLEVINKYLDAGGDPEFVIMSAKTPELNGYLRNQVWYDRFEKEYSLLEGQPTGGTIAPRTNALKAARKASGLE